MWCDMGSPLSGHGKGAVPEHKVPGTAPDDEWVVSRSAVHEGEGVGEGESVGEGEGVVESVGVGDATGGLTLGWAATVASVGAGVALVCVGTVTAGDGGCWSGTDIPRAPQSSPVSEKTDKLDHSPAESVTVCDAPGSRAICAALRGPFECVPIMLHRHSFLRLAELRATA